MLGFARDVDGEEDDEEGRKIVECMLGCQDEMSVFYTKDLLDVARFYFFSFSGEGLSRDSSLGALVIDHNFRL